MPQYFGPTPEFVKPKMKPVLSIPDLMSLAVIGTIVGLLLDISRLVNGASIIWGVSFGSLVFMCAFLFLHYFCTEHN